MGFTPSGIAQFLTDLNLKPQDFQTYVGASGPQEYILSTAFYMAVMAAGLPNDAVFQSIAKDPTSTLLCSMVSLLYGYQYQEDLKARLGQLGEALLRSALCASTPRKLAVQGPDSARLKPAKPRGRPKKIDKPADLS